MDIDAIFEHYSRGALKDFFPIVEKRMEDCAGIGDLVQLSRSFAYYGAANLVISNDFPVSTLYRQIQQEYAQTSLDDPRIKASYARFLGLYSAFNGKTEEASGYYSDTRTLYLQTDWFADEAIALLEGACWHYIFLEDLAGYYTILERLDALNSHLGGYLTQDLNVLRSFTRDNGILHFSYIKHNELALSLPVKILVGFTELGAAITDADRKNCLEQAVTGLEKINCPIAQILDEMQKLSRSGPKNNLDRQKHCAAIKTKSELFRHPWFKAEACRIWEFIKNSDPKQFADEKTVEVQRFSIHLFKNCEISFNGRIYDLNSFETRKGNELLLYLLTKNNLQVPKEAVAEVFFTDELPDKAYNRLYVNLHRLNKNLRSHFKQFDADDFIYIKKGIVCINPGIIDEIDTHKYRKILSVANQLWLDDKEAAVEVMYKAIGIYSEEIARGFYYSDWLEEYRQELKNMQIKALEKLFAWHLEKDESKPCSEAFYSLIALDPVNEDYYIQYMKYILRDGHSVEAANLFQRYKKVLEKELGLCPSFELQDLISCPGR